MSVRWVRYTGIAEQEAAAKGQVMARVNGVGVQYTLRAVEGEKQVHLFAHPDGPIGTPAQYGGTAPDYFRGLLVLVVEVGNDLDI